MNPVKPSLARRLAWFLALWLLGVGALGLVALAIRTAIMP